MEELVKQSYNKIVDKGIVLLKNLNSKQRKLVFKIVKNYSDMICFEIGPEDKVQMVLKYSPFIKEFLDMRELRKTGEKLYKNKEYDEAIKCYNKLLYFNKTRIFVYAKLGLIYMKKKDYPLAVDYLTVATELSKKEEKDLYNFSKLILTLKKQIIVNQKDLTVEDFSSDDNLDEKKIDEILNYILKSNLGFKKACLELGYNDLEIDRLILSCAKRYYTQGFNEIGDKFLEIFRKNKNKTEKSIEYYNEIVNNKKLYMNKENVSSKKLLLLPIKKVK